MTTIATTKASREGRRRRIVERGSERLALITGRIQSLPSEPDRSRSPACPPDQNPADSSQHEDVASGPSLPSQDAPKEEPSQQIASNETLDPLPSTHDKGRSIASRAVSMPGVEQEFSRVSTSMQRLVLEPQREQRRQGEQQSRRKSLTTGQIRSAVTASENIRISCSVAAAVLVILSYTGFPILGRPVFRSVVFFKPVYLLLLTNISIVVARLILAGEISVRQMSVPAFRGDSLVDQMGKALELGLLLQKIFEALFMDFSIYAVVLVCGLSLVWILGL